MLLTLSNLSHVSYSTFQDSNSQNSPTIDLLKLEFDKVEGVSVKVDINEPGTSKKFVKYKTVFVNITKTPIKYSNLISFVEEKNSDYFANCFLCFSSEQFEYIKSLILNKIDFLLEIETNDFKENGAPITSFNIKIDSVDLRNDSNENLEKEIVNTERYEAQSTQLLDISDQLKKLNKEIKSIKELVYVIAIMTSILLGFEIFK